MGELTNLEIAAQCWCDKECSEVEIDTRLTLAFNKRLDEKDLMHKVLVDELAWSESERIGLAAKLAIAVKAMKGASLGCYSYKDIELTKASIVIVYETLTSALKQIKEN